jgi:hypothetical protein
MCLLCVCCVRVWRLLFRYIVLRGSGQQVPMLARPACEDRVFRYLLTGQKGIGRVFPFSPRAPECNGGARVGTRPDQPELYLGASAGKSPSLAISVCALACPPLSVAVPPCVYFARGRVLRSVRCCCPFFQGWVKGHLNFDTGAGVK